MIIDLKKIVLEALRKELIGKIIRHRSYASNYSYDWKIINVSGIHAFHIEYDEYSSDNGIELELELERFTSKKLERRTCFESISLDTFCSIGD